ncbi:MAG TPA: hypothetical protein VHY79_03760 [Rhizomicrobium sp.]|jgi:hypothetical protein|nr:hypothetical protein [Rhizomicrobium sp.]
MNDTSSLWARQLEARLECLIQLRRGWDGYQAGPVTFTNAVFALNMLDRLYSASIPPPDLVPGYSGDLQAEWHIGNVDIELHVKGPNEVIAWRETPETGEDGEEISLTNDFTAVGEWIKQLANSANAIAAAAA